MSMSDIELYLMMIFSSLCHTMQTVIDREAAYTVKNTKTVKYPIILIITRVRRNTEILAVIHGKKMPARYLRSV